MQMRTAVTVITLTLALTACSGGDDASKPVAGTGETKPAAATGSDPVTRAAEKASEVTSCLDLVKQQKWSPAVDACTKAAGMEPQNEQVRTALQSAQKGLADAQMADAHKAAQGAADSAVKDATKGLMGGRD
jgi:hypothetical protein